MAQVSLNDTKSFDEHTCDMMRCLQCPVSMCLLPLSSPETVDGGTLTRMPTYIAQVFQANHGTRTLLR
jgi:hypothetical protein